MKEASSLLPHTIRPNFKRAGLCQDGTGGKAYSIAMDKLSDIAMLAFRTSPLAAYQWLNLTLGMHPRYFCMGKKGLSFMHMYPGTIGMPIRKASRNGKER
jgi:hypothetical protein